MSGNASATVYLVGAGPGDTGLITRRGLELLRRADAVVYDYLAPKALLDEAPDAAELVYVGKKGNEPHLAQDEVNEMLVKVTRRVTARGGTCVVRLKGGDPFVFGRGGEEALALAGAGVPFEVVPGVTSGIAAPAYAGIPVTHRGMASTVTFVTGHEDPEKGTSNVDWEALAALARAGGTLCLYMGMRNLESAVAQLLDAGLGGDTPVACVQWGTTPRQRSVVSTLADVAEEVRAAGIGAPAIIVVGDVAGLGGGLSWFEGRPLSARRIVVTRARSQAGGLMRRLRELGAHAVAFPAIALSDPDDFRPLDKALARIGSFDWVVFTSANGVDAFFRRLGGDARALAGARVAGIGPATAARLASHGIVADVVPDEYRGEAVFEAMSAAGSLAGANVLIARAQQAREALPALLRQAGARVEVAPAYKTVVPDVADDEVDRLARELEAGVIDGVTFTSPSTARNLVALLGDNAFALRRTTLYSIGPVTSAALRELGFERIVEAGEYTVDGVVASIMKECG